VISAAQLLAIMPLAGTRAALYAAPLNDACGEFVIATPRRQAAFVAQIAHESADLRYTAEIADGSEYENRTDLGNTQPGDGPRYKGRGLIQVTGRANYEACGVALGLPLIASPELLEEPESATRSAAWFWRTHGCNELADVDHFFAITRTVNGGFNGGDSRLSYWLRARAQLGVT
jgi:putative chitinase